MHISKKLYFTAKGKNCESNITQQNVRSASLLQYFLYNKKKIQIFGVKDFYFISWSETKKI